MRQIRKLQRRRSRYSSSFTVVNLEVELSDGQHLRLVLKDLSVDSLLSSARSVRPEFLYDAAREIETYRMLLNPRRFGTPICYGATGSACRRKHWLFLERVPGPLLWQSGCMGDWQEAARWLAKLHDEFDTHRHPRPASQVAHLLRYDNAFFQIWIDRAEQFLSENRAAHPRNSLRRFGRLTRQYDRVIARLLQMPTTLIHGEFYPSNVIVRENGNGSRICPIDWEVAAIAPGPIDLAALTSGNWSPNERQLLINAYCEASERANEWGLSDGALDEAVRYCQLHLTVQLLGWARDWSPPQQHAQNWLREACRLAEQLGV